MCVCVCVCVCLDVCVCVVCVCVCVDQDSVTVGSPGLGKRVSFERGLGSQTSAVLQLMRETLRKAGYDTDLEVHPHTLTPSHIAYFHSQTFLRETGIGYLFPRVELFLQEPDQDLSSVDSPIMSGM